MQYIIRTDEPFNGCVQSALNPDNTVLYTDGQNLEQFTASCGYPIRVIDGDELDKLLEEFHADLITDPEPITKEDWHEMLNCLPPSRWHSVGDFNVFHMCERLTGTLVSWFARQGSGIVLNHWTFTDHAHISDADLLAKLEKVK